MVSDRNGIPLLETRYARSLDPASRVLYGYLMGICASPAGVLKVSARKMVMDTGMPGKKVEAAMDRLAADGKIVLFGDRMLLADYPEYLPASGTVAKTLETVAREVGRIQDAGLREAVLAAFRSHGMVLETRDSSASVRKPRPERAKRLVPAPAREVVESAETVAPVVAPLPAVPESSALVVRRHAMAVSENEVDRYIDAYDAIFGDVAPRDKVPGERMGVVRGRRLMVKHRVAEMGDGWETRHEEVLRRARNSPFLCGRKTSFRMTFGWLIAARENAQRVMEGQYEGVAAQGNRTGALQELRKFAAEQGVGVTDPEKSGEGRG